MAVEVANESEIAVDEQSLSGICRFVLGEMEVNPLAELSVLCVDADYMASLHERWMGEKGPTDVLAFPMDEFDTKRPDDPEPGPALLGDVVLCPSVAIRQARAAGHTMDDELLLLATHGVLHLLGYDHMEPDEEKEMFGLQQRLLDSFRAAPRDAVTGEPTAGGPTAGGPAGQGPERR